MYQGSSTTLSVSGSPASWYGVLSLSPPLSSALSISLSPPQCHAPHPEAPAAEERGVRAVEAAVCVCAGRGLSDLPAGLARGPLLAVHQVRPYRTSRLIVVIGPPSSTMPDPSALLPDFKQGNCSAASFRVHTHAWHFGGNVQISRLLC